MLPRDAMTIVALVLLAAPGRPADSHIPGQIETEIDRCTQAINERAGGE